MAHLADSHIHLFRNGFTGRYGRSPSGMGAEVDVYESLRRCHGIEAALVIGYEDDDIDPENNAYLRELGETRPWMSTLAFLRASVRYSESDIDRLLAAGHSGVALYLTDADAATAVGTWSDEVWGLLDESAALVSVNVAVDAIPTVAALAAAHPGCDFLISHLGDPGSHVHVPSHAEAASRLDPLLDLATRTNVYVKLSGLYAISDPPFDYPHHQATPFVDIILDAFGPGRLLWGSDFSPSLDAVSFEQTVNLIQIARLSEDARARVMGGNLLELLGNRLPGPCGR